MCVGSCRRLFIVRTVVVYREVLLPSPLRTIVPAQRSEREWPGERAPERQGWICDESAEVVRSAVQGTAVSVCDQLS